MYFSYYMMSITCKKGFKTHIMYIMRRVNWSAKSSIISYYLPSKVFKLNHLGQHLKGKLTPHRLGDPIYMKDHFFKSNGGHFRFQKNDLYFNCKK